MIKQRVQGRMHLEKCLIKQAGDDGGRLASCLYDVS